jgi:hypothetical protein
MDGCLWHLVEINITPEAEIIHKVHYMKESVYGLAGCCTVFLSGTAPSSLVKERKRIWWEKMYAISSAET